MYDDLEHRNHSKIWVRGVVITKIHNFFYRWLLLYRIFLQFTGLVLCGTITQTPSLLTPSNWKPLIPIKAQQWSVLPLYSPFCVCCMWLRIVVGNLFLAFSPLWLICNRVCERCLVSRLFCHAPSPWRHALPATTTLQPNEASEPTALMLQNPTSRSKTVTTEVDFLGDLVVAPRCTSNNERIFKHLFLEVTNY